MPAGELHELSVAIGALQNQVKNLTETIRDDREESRTEHRKVHDIISALSDSVRTLDTTVKEMKPLTDDYREKRAEDRGAARFLKAGYALAGGSLAVGLGKALDWITVRPHP